MKNLDQEHNHEPDSEDEASLVLSNKKNIYLVGEINPMSTGSFLAALQEADSTPGLIKINISSNGGWVEGGMSMFDAILTTKNKVMTIGCGAVYSAAVLPFEAGDLRLMQESTRLFFHDMILSIGDATLSNVSMNTAECTKMLELMTGYIAKRAEMKPAKVLDMCKRETYVNAPEALALDLCDGVIENNYSKWFNKSKKTKTTKVNKKAKR